MGWSKNISRKPVLTVAFLAVLGLTGFLYFAFFCGKGNTRSPDNAKQKRILPLGEPRFTPPPQRKDTDLARHVERQWSLQDIKIMEAWKETKGRKDIVVAVIDTGTFTEHPCLKANLWINKKEIPNNKIDDDKNGFVDDIHGWNFVSDTNDIRDRHGHGTHIAGIIAASGKTAKASDCQTVGVAPNVTLMTLKYYDSGNHGGNIKNTIRAIEYAVENGAHIINYSGGGPGANPDERTAIAKAADKEVIFVSAAGNEGSKIGETQKKPTLQLLIGKNGNSSGIKKDFRYYPANYRLRNIISVNSKDKHRILDSSNWIKMDWREKDRVYNQTAPGKNIISTLPPRRYLSGFFTNLFRSLASESRPNEIYGYMTGTSQATAVASGVAALLRSRYPDWKIDQIIKQVNNTGYGEEAISIKQKTNQSKKLNAYEAIVSRDKTIDLTDQQTKKPTLNPENNLERLKNIIQEKTKPRP